MSEIIPSSSEDHPKAAILHGSAARKHISTTLDLRLVGQSLAKFAAEHGHISVKIVVAKLRIPLEKAKACGKTYAELSQWLTDQGISCSPVTLKIYLTRMARENRPNKGQKKPAAPILPMVSHLPKTFQPRNLEDL